MRKNKSRRKHSRKKGVPVASATVQPMLSRGILGYCLRAVMFPVRVVEQKPKTSVFMVSVLLVLALVTHGLTSNPLQTAPPAQPPPFVTITTNQWVYQPGDQITINVTVGPPGVNSDVIWVFLEQPNNISNYFHMLPNTGGIVNTTLAMDAPAGNWTAVAIWNPTPGSTSQSSFSGIATYTFTVTSYPIPEFPSGSLVTILALAFVFSTLLRGKSSVSAQAHSSDSATPHVC